MLCRSLKFIFLLDKLIGDILEAKNAKKLC
jgi:hypothetical protein